MTIELNEKSYIVGMWFSYDPITGNDWMSCIVKDPENPECYKGWSRFRYTKDSKLWNSADRKSWTTLTSKEGKTNQDMITTMRLLQRSIKEGYPDMDEIIVEGDIDKLFQLAEGKSWMNIKPAEEEE